MGCPRFFMRQLKKILRQVEQKTARKEFPQRPAP